MAVAGQAPKRGEERGVGELALAQVDALAEARLAATLGDTRRELGQQSGLAHAGVAEHEGERGGARLGLCERRLELGQLGRAADETGTRHAGGHARSMAGGRGG